MWYKDKNQIDYDKPILAKRKDGTILMLVPSLDPLTDHKTVGYNWLFLESGHFNSCCNFPDAKNAMKSYDDCEFRNIDLHELAKKEFAK